MGEQTKIEWTDHTFSPWWGCTKVSPACGMPLAGHEGEHHGTCYAESFSNRLGFNIWGQNVGRRFFGDGHWSEPEKWNRKAEKEGIRRRVFCGSMCDVMEDRRDLDSHRERLYGLIQRTPWLNWLLLTKRPQNFRRLLPAEWVSKPEPNVWVMATVETPEYGWRIEALRNTPAVMRGLSMEPLLAGFDSLDLSGIGFVIAGGESGHGARPMHPSWPRAISVFCAQQNVRFFFKQWGEWQNGSGLTKDGMIVLNDGRVVNSSNDVDQETRDHWGDYRPTMMLRVGKKNAGRLLDGRGHNEMPK